MASVKNKFNQKPKVIRSDRGGEYMSERLLSFLKSEGIQTEHTAPYTPEQNGVAERKNRSLIEMARCLLTDANLPYFLWAEAVNTANYIQNRTITKGADFIPCNNWNGEKPRVNHFEVFGTKCYVHIPAQNRTKLENTAKQMRFIGYEDGSKAYRCYDALNRKLVVSRDVRFVQARMHQGAISIDFFSKKNSSESTENTKNDDTGNENEDSLMENTQSGVIQFVE